MLRDRRGVGPAAELEAVACAVAVAPLLDVLRPRAVRRVLLPLGAEEDDARVVGSGYGVLWFACVGGLVSGWVSSKGEGIRMLWWVEGGGGKGR